MLPSLINLKNVISVNTKHTYCFDNLYIIITIIIVLSFYHIWIIYFGSISCEMLLPFDSPLSPIGRSQSVLRPAPISAVIYPCGHF